jgi:hypothetical protein
MWPIIIIAVVIYAMSSEDGSQNCTKGFCHHLQWYPSDSTDPTGEVVLRLQHYFEARSTFVQWRLGLVAAVLVTLLLGLVLEPKSRNGLYVFILAVVVVMTTLYAVADGVARRERRDLGYPASEEVLNIYRWYRST